MSADVKFDSGLVLVGSCLERLRELEDASIDSIVTDPPYELGFMGKDWDNSGIAYSVKLWVECLRVLKPGGHLLAFGATRTYHRMAVAIEDAGFEIRDSIHWVYGSGFPKSHNVSKAIDKEAGAEREVVGTQKTNVGIQGGNFSAGSRTAEINITAPATDDAKTWEGWGTALKPAHEPIMLARKPLAGTVAANVKEHGTGALNIDACRIGDEERTYDLTMTSGNFETTNGGKNEKSGTATVTGRWPANVIFDEAAGAELDAQSGIESSRFFYCPKPGKKERNAGLDGLAGKQVGAKGNGLARKCATCSANVLDGCSCPDRTFENPVKQNFHPTVKPVSLMRYLVRLVTPPNGTVLDPFLGSGTTAVAAIAEGFKWVGCEMTADYLPIISGRVTHAQTEKTKQQETLPKDNN